MVVSHAPTLTASLKNEGVSMFPKLSENSIKIVYTDRCCAEKDIIRSVFGPDVEIKLDIRHYNDRINRTLRDSQLSKNEKANFRNDVLLLTRQKHDKEVFLAKPTKYMKT